MDHSTESWRIDDTLFCPLGLINHTTGSKTVFVTWSDKYLLNFIFKKISETSSRCNKFIINVPDEIVDIVILEVNTLLLLKNGEVFYFSSIKSIHAIPWLSCGVRCVSQSVDGFSLIRVLEDKRITLELYKDVPNVGKNPQEVIKSFDLTFDEKNLFDSDWSDVSIKLQSIEVTDRNRRFMELLVGDIHLQAQEVHVFSISNCLFALYVTGEDDYEIKTLAPQVSPVELVKFLPEQGMLLVFLSCGIIVVWFLSKMSLIIERYTYINGSEFVHHTFADDVLYFTDEQRVCRLTFAYDAIKHTCQVSEQSIDAPGMIAVTYEEVSGSLVCLSNNNLFYHLSFDGESTGETPEDPELFELTDEKFNEMLSKSDLLRGITSLPEQIDRHIEEEYRKQELIAVSRKSVLYSELVSAEISFSQHIPETEERLIFSTENGIEPFTYFALVSLKIVVHEIFKSTIWKLMIAYESHVRLLPITPELLQQKFTVLLPIKANPDDLLPEFDIQMLTHVSMNQDFVCISIPVKVDTVNVMRLFSLNQGLRSLAKDSEKRGTLFSFKVTAQHLSAPQAGEIFGLSVGVETDVLTQSLYFLGERVSLLFSEETKILLVESCDPVALYYAKICISKYLWLNCRPSKKEDDESLRKKLLEIQCNVEKRYGDLAESEAHLDNLRKIYDRLRSEIAWKF